MRRLLLLAALILAAGVVSGCYSAYDTHASEMYADQPPPPPYAESVGPAPGPGWVYVPGYWTWTGRRYVWVDGNWRRPPRQGHIWVSGAWVAHSGRYRYLPGRWATPSRARYYRSVRPAPVHRAGPPPPRDRDRRPPPPRDRDRRPPPPHRGR